MHTVGVRVYDVLVNVRYMYVVDESYNSMISFACYYCVYMAVYGVPMVSIPDIWSDLMCVQ